jgi:hypothetical protein
MTPTHSFSQPWTNSELWTNFYWLGFVLLGWYLSGYAQRKFDDAKLHLDEHEKFGKHASLDATQQKQQEFMEEQWRRTIKTYSSRRVRIALDLLAYGLILFGVAAATAKIIQGVEIADYEHPHIIATFLGYLILSTVVRGHFERKESREKELETLKRKLDEAIFCCRLEKSQRLESSITSIRKEYDEKSGEKEDWIQRLIFIGSCVFGGVLFAFGIAAAFYNGSPLFKTILFAAFIVYGWNWEIKRLRRVSEKAELDIKHVTGLLNVVSYHLAQNSKDNKDMSRFI